MQKCTRPLKKWKTGTHHSDHLVLIDGFEGPHTGASHVPNPPSESPALQPARHLSPSSFLGRRAAGLPKHDTSNGPTSPYPLVWPHYYTIQL